MGPLKKAILIVGRISSGKSTIAQSVSSQYEIPIASFGGYLKDYCTKLGLPIGRNNLQNIGDRFINERPREFLLDVIKFSDNGGGKMILEGVRHKVIFDMIKEICPNNISFFVEVSDQVRLARFLTRQKDSDIVKSESEFATMNSHPVELEVQSLKEFCDFIIESSDPKLKIKLKSFFDLNS